MVWSNRARFDCDQLASGQEGQEPSQALGRDAVARLASAWQATADLTGADIACALRHAGCDVRLAPPEHVSLFRDGVEMARLPLSTRVRTATLRALLRSLDVSTAEFARCLLNETERPER